MPPVVLQVELGAAGRRYARQPVAALLRQHEYAHDVALLTYDSPAPSRLTRGQPLRVRWGYPGRTEDFVGHLHSTRLVTDEQTSRLRSEVYAVGPTYRMNAPQRRSSSASTLLTEMRRLAERHRLAVVAEVDDQPCTALTQHGRSDWRMLVVLAEQAGWTVTAARTAIVVRRRVVEPERARATLLRGAASAANELLDFTLHGRSAPLERPRRYVSAGIDDDGRLVHDVEQDCCSDAGDFDTFDGAPAQPHRQTQRRLSGRSRASGLSVRADVTAAGQPSLRCGDTVRLDGVEPAASGFWFAHRVEHRLTGTRRGRPDRYVCALGLGRDSIEPLCPDLPRPPQSWSGRRRVVDGGVDLRLQVPPTELAAPGCSPLEVTPPQRCVCLQAGCRHVYDAAPGFDAWYAVAR